MHGHFLPWVSQERAYKKLGKGDMFITIDRRSGLDGVYRYEGEIDSQGRACGFGIAKMINVKEEIVYQGYFFEDHFHGLGLYKTAAE